LKDKKYYGLIFEANISRRTRLKTAATASAVFDRVDVTQTVDEALKRLQENDIEVVFFCGLLPTEEQTEFVTKAKLTRYGSNAAYICVQKRTDNSSSVVSSGIIRGIDGILWEPYSTDDVAGTAVIAERIRAANAVAKRKAATGLLLEEAFGYVDFIGGAALSGNNELLLSSIQKLRNIGPDIRKIATDSESLFIEVCRIKLSNSLPQSLSLLRQPYGGVSQRVQRIIDKRGRERIA
jgi:hypothetical protein